MQQSFDRAFRRMITPRHTNNAIESHLGLVAQNRAAAPKGWAPQPN